MSSKCGKYIYDPEEEFGSGGYGHIFIAENEDEIKKGEKKFYILKIHEEGREKDDEQSFNDEIDILYELTKIPEKYLPPLYMLLINLISKKMQKIRLKKKVLTMIKKNQMKLK